MSFKRMFLISGIFLLLPIAVSATEYFVSIPGFLFSPPALTIAPGDIVTWTNDHAFNHTTTSDDGLEWDSGILTPGQSFSHTFLADGAFPYHCAIHLSMTGTITVAPPSVCGPYVVGDFNGSNSFNVADIISAFGRLRGLPNEPALLCECPAGSGNMWAVAMDVNNSCAFNIADIIWGFGKLQGLPNVLVPCAACPPGAPSPHPGD